MPDTISIEASDRELLELAAKAAGIRIKWDKDGELRSPLLRDALGDVPWNPLTDDGDALRLAVKLGMKLQVRRGVETEASYADKKYGGWSWETEGHSGDPMAATRRAIVRAAASIGEQQCRT
jgi:hypothetical protein